MVDNPKRFWGLLKTKTKNKNIPENIHNEDVTENTSIGKAKLFNNFFYSNFSSTANDSNLPPINEVRNQHLCSLNVSIAETRLVLDNIDPNKATGPDNISGRILKECSKEISPSLTALFNLSLRTGLVPLLWKSANVTPVFKKGEKSNCKNYRPISLLCIVSKVLERTILNQIKKQIIPQISKFQHGFLFGKSTETQLLTVYDQISKVLDNSGQTDIIYLDLSKAFDSVPHHLLCHKLKAFGFHGRLLSWFSSYVNERKQRTVLEGEASDWLPVLSGVPQGSILGPVLFIMYINDMVDQVSDSTSIGLFADDAKLARTINSLADCETLQRDLITLENWSKTWHLFFNAGKCKLLHLARTIKIRFEYRLNDKKLDSVHEFNDLGILISSDFSWQAHIKNKVKKANSLLGFIKRTCGFNAPTAAKRTLYLSLIRSTLMYNSTMWSPSKSELKHLEGVQRRATKYILNDYTSSYKDRLYKLGLIPLSFYREFRDLCFLFKCIRSYYNINLDDHISFVCADGVRTRHGHELYRLKIPRMKTEKGTEFYFCRVVPLWNSLPLAFKSLNCSNKNIVPFKTAIFRQFQERTSSVFDVDNVCSWVSVCRCPTCRPV